MNGRQTVGKRGEDEACLYLVERGHVIVDRNWRSSHLELDIVSLAEDGVHFVEVKSRTAPVLAEPELNVNSAKRSRMVRAAGAWLATEAAAKVGKVEAFFDVLTVVFDGSDTHIEYYPKAFIPIYV